MREKDEQIEYKDGVNKVRTIEQYNHHKRPRVLTVTSKEDVAIPQVIQEYLNQQDGSELEWIINDSSGDIIVTVKRNKSEEVDLLNLFGSLPVEEQSERDFNDIREEARLERIEEMEKRREN